VSGAGVVTVSLSFSKSEVFMRNTDAMLPARNSLLKSFVRPV
jgi:hypothetical protein